MFYQKEQREPKSKLSGMSKSHFVQADGYFENNKLRSKFLQN